MHDVCAEHTPGAWKKRISFFLLAISGIVLTLTCGKKAPPSPPIPIVPTPAQEVKITQAGTSLLFAFKIPRLSTDEKTLVELGKLVIYRLKAPRIPTTTSATQTAPAGTQTAPQTQTAPRTQTSPQTQTALRPQTAPQTQTQTQTQTAPQETARTISAEEFEEQAEKIAEIPEDKIDSYLRDG